MLAQPPREPADAALSAGLRARDPESLAALYDRFARQVHGLVLRIVKSPHDAEEITQDVFLYAWQRSAQFDAARGNLAAWLLVLARSRAIDRLRARRSRERSIEAAVQAAAVVPAAPPDPSLALLDHERRQRIERALATLTEPQREAVLIAFFEGLSHTEVAERLQAPLGTVKTRIRQGMLRLRDALQEP
jgi:RNA polymerase sigma-70 factor (ECF subfamily)